MIKNFVLSDFATKTAHFSLIAAVVVFVSMLLLTGAFIPKAMSLLHLGSLNPAG